MHRSPLRLMLLALALLLTPDAGAMTARAQTAGVAFGGLTQDTSAPVNVTSDELAVDQNSGVATFTGNVVVTQGDLKLTAPRVEVTYTPDRSAIETVHATDGVTIVSPTDAAEGREAVYTIGTGAVVMTGDVLLTQAASAISGQRLVIDLNTGKGAMTGRVQTVFAPRPKTP